MAEGLEVGMKLHAMYTDGNFYPAVVEAISTSKQRQNKPVKVSFVGYAETAWKSVDDLKSKTLRRENVVKTKERAMKTKGKSWDYSGLEKGMRMQAEFQGTFYAAEVVTISQSQARAKAPVKVRWLGYTAASDEWMSGDRLRSKALRVLGSKENSKQLGKSKQAGHGRVGVPAMLDYKRATVVRSAKHTDERLKEAGILTFGPDGSNGAQDDSVYICKSSGNQAQSKPFLGFGGSFTEASAVVFYKMSKERQDEIMKAYYDAKDGIGFELGRISIASCDFGLGNWTCGDLIEGDTELSGFNIDHYEEYILPLCMKAAAVKNGPLTLVASPWSPPPWMKTKRQFHGDGHLKAEYASTWATHFVKFLQAFQKRGIEIWGVTVQNEPEAAQRWESCIYSAEEERDFVKNHLGPALKKAGFGSVKIMIWDHNRDGMLERAAVAYSDPEAAKYIWGVAYHWYGDARFETWPQRFELPFEDRQRDCAEIMELRARAGFDNVRKVAELRPDKHIIFTEGCQELGGRELKDILGEWKFGERYGMNIINDLNSGTEGWIDWNLYLNEKGGPNHVDNNCLAPIICDTAADKVSYEAPYWYLGHFSKYIRPGARKLICSTSRDVLETLAFINPDGTIVLVVMNQSEDAVNFWLKLPDRAAKATSTPRSITTFIIDDSDEGVDPILYKARMSRVGFETANGKFIQATEAGWSPEVGLAEQKQGWETFRQFQKDGNDFCYIQTFHDTWLTVTEGGSVGQCSTAGQHERFTLVPHGDKFAIKSCAHGTYLSIKALPSTPQSAADDCEEYVVTATTVSDTELFIIHCEGVEASACS